MKAPLFFAAILLTTPFLANPLTAQTYTPAPKPSATELAAFKTALGSCSYLNANIDAPEKDKKINDLIAKLSAPTPSLGEMDVFTLNKFTNALLFPAFPSVPLLGAEKTRYDREDTKLVAGATRAMAPFLQCPSRTKQAAVTKAQTTLPLLHWMADTPTASDTARMDANHWLGLIAREGVGQKADKEAGRKHFLIMRMFGGNAEKQPHQTPAFWSDGQDNDVYANIKRAGLEPYFDIVTQNSTGWFQREIKAAYLVKTDPQAAKAVLQSGNPKDEFGSVNAGTLYKMEEEGLIPKTATDADLAYWASATEAMTMGLPHRRRVIEIATARNKGPIAISNSKPTAAQAYPGTNAASFFAKTELPAAPLAFRALVAPDGKPLLVQLCPGQKDTWKFRQDNPEMGKILRGQIKTLPPVKQSGKPVYGWVKVPGPYKDPQTGKASFGWAQTDTCANDPELKTRSNAPPLYEVPEPPKP